MAVQKCVECSETLSWKDIIKSVIRGYAPIKCRRCGTAHRISFKSRLVMASSISIAVLSGMLLNGRYEMIPLFIMGIFIWGILMIAVSTLYARCNKEE